jgi:Tol biopolymer transport system component
MTREPSPAASSGADGGASDRLDSWKDVAAYLRRDVTTVQRWERREGLPIRRHVHDKQGSVYAFRSELDRWQRTRTRWSLPASKRALGTIALLTAVFLVAVVAQRMLVSPSARVVRSVQLTFSGVAAAPGFETDHFPAIASDGARVYFNERTENGTRHTLVQGSVGGGQVVTIPTPFRSALLLHVSPDGSRLLVREFDHAQVEGPLWVIPTVGEAPHRLGAIVAHDAAWSPDGKRVVFACREKLYVAASDGSDARQLATIPGRAFWVRWSPDGARLRFTLLDPQNSIRSIWEVSTGGHGLQPLPVGRGEHDLDCCGEWSPDGRHFFFSRFRDNRADIWIIRERSGLFGETATPPAQLTSGPLHFTAVVPTRQDGRLLAIGAHRGKTGIGGLSRGENLRFDSVRREFVPYEAGGRAGWFAFSRDGEWVAYVEYRETTILWRSRVDGSDRVQLTQPPRRVLLPRWSPDGGRIAFMGRMPGKPWRINTIPAEGGEPQSVLQEDRAESDPDWAPDGASLMFGRPPDYLADSSVPNAIFLLDLRSMNFATLPDSDGLFSSRWSPSGRYVAAMTLDQAVLRLFDFSSGAWTELGRFKTVHNPAWSRDERFLYFEVVDEASIYRLRISDRSLERVARLDDVWKSRSGYCVFEGLTPDDSPLVSCNRFDSEIYALDWEMK